MCFSLVNLTFVIGQELRRVEEKIFSFSIVVRNESLSLVHMQKEAPFPGRKNIKKFADICSIHHSNYFVGDTLWIFKYSGSTFLSSNFSIHL